MGQAGRKSKPGRGRKSRPGPGQEEQHCEDYTELPRPPINTVPPMHFNNGFNSMPVPPHMGMMGMNPLGKPVMMNLNQQPNVPMPMPEMGMNPMMNSQSQMLLMQYHQQQMLMISMGMTSFAAMLGGFNPMLNPATAMMQQQMWMNSQNQQQQRATQQTLTQPAPAHPVKVEVKVKPKAEPESEGEFPDSNKSASDDSDSDSSSKNKKRMTLPSAIPLTPQSPTPIGVIAKRMRSELDESQPMDVEFRNPNAETESETKTATAMDDVQPTENSVEKQGDGQETGNDTYSLKLKDYRAKTFFKKNHIWSELATNEEIEETAKQFDVVTVTDTFSIIRGSETYVVGAKRKRKLPMDENGVASATPVVEENVDDQMSDSSVSSGGLSDHSKDLVRKSKASRRNKMVKVETGITDTDLTEVPAGTENTKDSDTANGNGVIKLEAEADIDGDSEMQVNIEKPKPLPVWKHEFEEKIKTLEDYQVAHAISARLKERKKKLMLEIMKTLGREVCKKLYYKTMKIERLGGLLIKNGKRRRTAGGVFIYLLRNDQRISEEAKDKIFQEEREFHRQQKRKATPRNKAKWENNIHQKLFKGFSKEPVNPQGSEEMPPDTKGEANAIDSDAEADDMDNSYPLPKNLTPGETVAPVDPSNGCPVPTPAKKVENPLYSRGLVLYDDIEQLFEAYSYEKFGPKDEDENMMDQEQKPEEENQDVPPIGENLQLQE